MGTWSTKIDSNDTFQDIYRDFFNMYNKGEDPAYISKLLFGDSSDTSSIDDDDEYHNMLFGLAMAQWETKSLDDKIYQQVKEIIESGSNLKFWNEADEKTLAQRKTALDQFLIQISVPKAKPKRRKKSKFEVTLVTLLKLTAPDAKKTLTIDEIYNNGVYQTTSMILEWPSSGGSGLFHFHEQGKFITARWLDSQTIEVRYDKTINYGGALSRKETFQNYDDRGVIIYIPE
jgi:hypothetical protein